VRPGTLRCALAALTASLMASAAHAASTERFALIAHDENVGHVYAQIDGRTVDIDYVVDDNGRGPKHKEHLVLDASGVPVEWTIHGTSLMGGAVDETLGFKDGVERWTSQADKGEVKTAKPQLYIGNDASPWALGLYVQTLLKTPGGALDVLPAGRLKLEKLHEVTVGEGARAIKVDAYRLSGVDITPELLLMDKQGRLFADLGGSVLVREGYEKDADALAKLGASLTLELLEGVQKRVAHAYDAPIRIRNVHLFDPKTESTGDLVSLVVFRGRITTIEKEQPGAPAPKDEVVIDGQGGTLVAGLHDMHAHNSLWSGLFYLAAGVTTTRDMGNVNAMLLDLTQRLDAGDLPGPHIVPSGFIEGRSPYSARLGFIPDSLDDGIKDVDWYADRGYLQIKIYNSMTPDWVKPLSTEARRLGMRTVGHVPAFTTPDRMIEDGYNEVTHINQLMLGWLLQPGEDTRTPLRLTAMARAADLDLNSEKVRHTIEVMKSHNTGLDTTAVILERLMLSRAGEVQAGDKPYLDHMPIGYQRYRKRSFVNFKDDAEKARYQAAFDKLMQTLTLLHKEGIRLWPGTDDTTGFTVHRELELYAQLGMTPGEVLKIATFDIDQYLGRDQSYGSLERGKQADFFLVPGDPSKNISDVRQIRMTMKGGVIYYPAELYAELGIRPFAAPPPLTLPSAASRTAETPLYGFGRGGFSQDEDELPID
jgi:hypothetical protein